VNLRTRPIVSRLLVASAAAVVVVVVLLALPGGIQQDGPIATTDAVTVEYEYAAGEATTWGTTLPPAGGVAVATLLSVEPIGASGLEVIGVEACDTSIPGCNVVNARGWPLTGIPTEPIAGLAIRRSDSEDPRYHLLMGVRRQPGANVATITAIKLTYQVGGTTYEVTEPWTLRILAPGMLADPS
jgi:hypothetical protein